MCIFVDSSRRWNASRWNASRWIASRWIASRWIASRWIASRWIASRWIASRWIASRWIAPQNQGAFSFKDMEHLNISNSVHSNRFLEMAIKVSSFLAFVLLFPAFGMGAEPVVLEEGTEVYSLGSHLEILEDPGGLLTVEEVSSPQFSQQFVTNEVAVPNFGFSSSAYWVKFTVENWSNEKEWLLELSYVHLKKVDFYFPKASGGFERIQTGTQFPFEQRELRNRTFVFRLLDLSKEPRVFYLRVWANGGLTIPLKIWSVYTFFEQTHEKDRAFGIYYGAMMVMVFYNLFLFVSTRQFNYLFYICYIASFILYQMVSNGLAYEYLWPNFPEWNHRSWSFFLGLSLFWAVIFTQNFLQTALYTPLFHKMCYGILALSVVSMSFVLVPVSLFTVQFSTFLGIPSVLVAIGASILCWKRGYRPARYYLLGWSSLMFGAMLASLKVFGVLPSMFLTNYGMQIGSVLEVILLSLGLADRLKVLEQEKLEAEKRISEQEREYRKLEHMVAQKEILEKAQEYQELMENLNVGVFRIQYETGKIVKFNNASMEIVGYDSSSMGEITTQTLFRYRRDRSRLRELLTEHGGYKNQEIILKRKDGSSVWVSASATVQCDEQGDMQWTDCIIEDITQRKEADEKIQRLSDTFEKFVPRQFLKRIASEGIDHIELGKAQTESLSVLFADIRAFTEFSESATPQETLDFLNTYVAQMNKPIQSCYGFIDKFIGDGIMALFDRPTHAMDSFHSSVAMTQAIRAFNEERAQENLSPISIGIAIHTGNAIIGTVGTEDRMDSTVLGDTVNLAARMEDLTKYYNAQIIISADTRKSLDDESLLCRELDFIAVKGKKIPKRIFEVFNGNEANVLEKKQKILVPYAEGLQQYRERHWEEAIGLFKQCLEIYPQDVVCQIYIERCHRFQRNPPPASWMGETKMH